MNLAWIQWTWIETILVLLGFQELFLGGGGFGHVWMNEWMNDWLNQLIERERRWWWPDSAMKTMRNRWFIISWSSKHPHPGGRSVSATATQETHFIQVNGCVCRYSSGVLSCSQGIIIYCFKMIFDVIVLLRFTCEIYFFRKKPKFLIDLIKISEYFSSRIHPPLRKI